MKNLMTEAGSSDWESMVEAAKSDDRMLEFMTEEQLAVWDEVKTQTTMTAEQFAIWESINVTHYMYFDRVTTKHLADEDAVPESPEKAIHRLSELILDCECAARRARSAIAKLTPQ